MFIRTAASFRQGARTLPREYYTSADIFAAEQDAIFGRLWNCVGRSSRSRSRATTSSRNVADESIIVVRGRDAIVRAFFNVCRHRGTRLCSNETGRFQRRHPVSRTTRGPTRSRAPDRRAAHAGRRGIRSRRLSAACRGRRRVERIPVRERRTTTMTLAGWFAPSPRASIDSTSRRFRSATMRHTTCRPTGSSCSRTTPNACIAR